MENKIYGFCLEKDSTAKMIAYIWEELINRLGIKCKVGTKHTETFDEYIVLIGDGDFPDKYKYLDEPYEPHLFDAYVLKENKNA